MFRLVLWQKWIFMHPRLTLLFWFFFSRNTAFFIKNHLPCHVGLVSSGGFGHKWVYWGAIFFSKSITCVLPAWTFSWKINVWMAIFNHSQKFPKCSVHSGFMKTSPGKNAKFEVFRNSQKSQKFPRKIFFLQFCCEQLVLKKMWGFSEEKKGIRFHLKHSVLQFFPLPKPLKERHRPWDARAWAKGHTRWRGDVPGTSHPNPYGAKSFKTRIDDW